VYCLDANFRMLWLAEWPHPEDLCGRIVDEVDNVLVLESVGGLSVRLDANTGRVVTCQQPVAAAS
jgi:hypothetical protein